MNNNTKKQHHVHEPRVKVVKRDGMVWYKAWGVRIIAVLLALAVCSVVLVVLTSMLGNIYNPIEIFATMFKGNFGTTRKVWNTLHDMALLLCISLAVTPAFKMKFWNIGAEGQTLIGGLCAAACMKYMGASVPPYLMIPVMTIVCILSGVIWGIIPAFFKAKYNTNETLFTLMMNYVAMQLVRVMIAIWVPSGSGILQAMKVGKLPVLFGIKPLFNIIIVALLTVGMYIYLKYSKHGYEISVVGESENTARYIGINVKKVILRTMALSGGLCGLAGMLIVAGTDYTVASTSAGGMGFTAIMVSWLAKFNPVVMVLTSLLIVFFEGGASEIATAFSLNQSIADIITGIILFFIIGSEFFVNYKINFRSHKNHKEV